MTDVAKSPSPLAIHGLMSRVEARDATIAPDGKMFAYLCDDSGTMQVWTGDLSGGAPRQLTDMPEKIGAIAFCPVSRDLIFTMDCGGDERHQLWLIADGGGGPELLTRDPTAIHAWGAWSPDGKQIAYSAYSTSGMPQTRSLSAIRSG